MTNLTKRFFCRLVLELLIIIAQQVYKGKLSEHDLRVVNAANDLKDDL